MFAWMNLTCGIFASLSFASFIIDESRSTAKTFPFGILVDNILVYLPEPQPASRTISFPFQFTFYYL
ncbi:MAG: hypothetical protein ACR2F1_00860 [Nitrososphaeraceae archaeon]